MVQTNAKRKTDQAAGSDFAKERAAQQKRAGNAKQKKKTSGTDFANEREAQDMTAGPEFANEKTQAGLDGGN